MMLKSSRWKVRQGGKRLLCLALALPLLAGVLFAFSSLSAGKGVADKLLRLHVLAASDSPEDQALKLKVRDAVLESAAPYLDGCGSADEAERQLAAHEKEIVAAADTILQKAGKNDAVTVEFGEEYYPTREYENVALPAGKYRSVRVKIGNAEGHNWWCVLYPPLCLAASAAPEQSEIQDEEALLEAGLTKDETALITGFDREENGEKHFTLRFRFLELWGELWEALGF